MRTPPDISGVSEVAEGIWAIDAPFTGVALTVYLIDAGSEIALVDSGIATTPDAFILPVLERAGARPDLLINTHGHVDHFGGNARLKSAFPNLRVAAHMHDARWIEDTRRHLGEFYMQMPEDWFFEDGGKAFLQMCGGNTAVDHRLDDGDVLRIGERAFSVFRSGGHSPGHVCLHERETGVAFVGDAALGWGPETADGTPDAPAVFYDADAYVAGARMAEALEASLYCTGHFGAIDPAAMSRLVADSARYVDSFLDWTLEALAERRARTLHDVALHVSSRLPGYEFGFHIHASAQAALERHLHAGNVRTEIHAGRRHYLRTAGRPT